MNCKMNTKFIAALAVFAMAFAGFGMVFATEANDAEDEPAPAPAATKTFTMVFEGVYLDAADEAVAYLATGGEIKYAATLDEDFEEKITVLTKDYYDAMKAACTIKGDAVTFQMADGKIVPKEGCPATVSVDDAFQGLIIFTSFEVSKTDEISGVTTQIVIKDALVTKDVTYDLVFEDDAEAAIAVAVAIAVAETVEEVEAEYADYLSPEEVEAAVEAAVAAAKEKYKDWSSPEDVVAKIAKAIEDYKAANPVKKDDTFLYVTIVLAAVVLALGGFMVFDKVIKPKMAKKEDETQVI